MKLLTLRQITLVLLLAMVSIPLAAQVYKTVDENGNVVYTDQPPSDGSKPIELRPISVIEAPVYEKAAPADADTAAEEESKEKPLRFLRKHYEGFTIVSPTQEESIWYANQVVPIAWATPNPLEEGMLVTVTVDGSSQPPTSEPVVAFTDLERGEHTASAVLRDSKNRVIATAETVTFFIRQPNLYMNAPRPTPRGGN